MPVGRVATAVDRDALFIERARLADHVRVAVERQYVVADLFAFGIKPRACAEAVPRVRLARREVGPPRLGIAGIGRLGKLVAMRVRALQPAEVGSCAGSLAGNEEAHRVVLRARRADAQVGRGSQCFDHQPHWKSPRHDKPSRRMISLAHRGSTSQSVLDGLGRF